jgi:signal transduction histidine kinase
MFRTGRGYLPAPRRSPHEIPRTNFNRRGRITSRKSVLEIRSQIMAIDAPDTRLDARGLPVNRLNTSSIQFLNRRSRFGVAAGSLVLVAVFGWIDFVAGIEVSVMLLYLVPVGLSAWFGGRGMGMFIAAASAVAWLGADLLERGVPGQPWVPVWNTLMVAGTFAAVAATLAALKRTNENLESTVTQRMAELWTEIAERRRAEEQLRRANAELQRTHMQLIEAAKMETVGRMAAGVAHEVKNPLMTLGMGADYFLQRKPATDDEAALLQDMKEAVRRASNIINLMLDFSKPHPLQLAAEDLNLIIEDSLKLMQHQLLQQRVDVVRQLQADLPPVPLDRTRMEHVLVNLMTNAAQAMPEGGTLTLRTASHGELAPAGEPQQITVDIEDTGPGIPAEHLSNVFEPFFTTKPPGQGTGLGLAIVHKLVQIHRGTVTLGNRPEGGARATLTFTPEAKEQP